MFCRVSVSAAILFMNIDKENHYAERKIDKVDTQSVAFLIKIASYIRNNNKQCLKRVPAS
jgi:hypothetical protein